MSLPSQRPLLRDLREKPSRHHEAGRGQGGQVDSFFVWTKGELRTVPWAGREAVSENQRSVPRFSESSLFQVGIQTLALVHLSLFLMHEDSGTGITRPSQPGAMHHIKRFDGSRAKKKKNSTCRRLGKYPGQRTTLHVANWEKQHPSPGRIRSQNDDGTMFEPVLL